MQLRHIPAMTIGLLSLLCLAGACGDDGRKGGAGSSCTKTDDCESPLECVNEVCVGGGAGGSASGTTTGTTSGTTSGTATGTGTTSGTASGSASGTATAGTGGTGGIGPGESTGACDDCLDTECASELEACGTECVAVEACIEAVCRSIGDATEGDCFVYCQDQHPAGINQHLAVVNCAFDGIGNDVCYIPNGPCVPYPQDYDACRATLTAGNCSAQLAACNASADCATYRDCTSTCGTNTSCIACSSVNGGFEGRQLLEALEGCIAGECLSESWLP
jgi:hypothetical protein